MLPSSSSLMHRLLIAPGPVCLLLTALVLPVTVSGQILGCDGDDPCRCTFSDGSGTLDISSLGNVDGTARFTDTVGYDGKTYSFNPCFPFSTQGCSDAAICEKDASGATYTRIARQTPATWSYSGFYPIVTYSNTDGTKTEVSMICDQLINVPVVDVFGVVTPGTFSVNLWSVCACPGMCKKVVPPGASEAGLTTGSILLIIFFTVLAVYLLAGVAFNYQRQREVNRTILPNTTFWGGLPGLVKDGFAFTVAKVRGQPNQRTYENI